MAIPTVEILHFFNGIYASPGDAFYDLAIVGTRINNPNIGAYLTRNCPEITDGNAATGVLEACITGGAPSYCSLKFTITADLDFDRFGLNCLSSRGTSATTPGPGLIAAGYNFYSSLGYSPSGSLFSGEVRVQLKTLAGTLLETVYVPFGAFDDDVVLSTTYAAGDYRIDIAVAKTFPVNTWWYTALAIYEITFPGEAPVDPPADPPTSSMSQECITNNATMTQDCLDTPDPSTMTKGDIF